MKFILGVIITLAGVGIVVKSNSLVGFFGRIAFFDKYLGTEGGTRLGYKLIGVLAIFIGVLMITGLIDGFMNWLLGPLIKSSGNLPQ